MSEDINKKLLIVASNIRIIRKNKRKSQTQVAKKLKISQYAYCKMELGKTKITLITLLTIAKYFEVDIAAMLITN
ncbi:MAG TPA: helix-turn-helix transcriptional regulator [Mucilaginibacter sp.]|nr:helix-turn-helix transcriptional regulator [Mucilaginibacter sp.]